MSTSVGIVAHPARDRRARDLADDIDAQVIRFDTTSSGEQATHQATLEALLELDTDWIVLIEDDAIPCPRFRERLDATLPSAGDAIVSLYLGTGRWAGTVAAQHETVVRGLIEHADATDAHWIDADALWHAVAVCIPRTHAAGLLDHLTTDTAATDQAITHWAQHAGVPIRYAWPSLVDHDDEGSLAHAAHGVPRHAWRVAT